MVFRCNPDGSQVECLGSNDDGNRGVRINYVMEYGNFGFHDEMTNAACQVPRTNMEDSIFDRHLHQNDPGIIPNLLQQVRVLLRLIICEGSLLPQKFQGQMKTLTKK